MLYICINVKLNGEPVCESINAKYLPLRSAVPAKNCYTLF